MATAKRKTPEQNRRELQRRNELARQRGFTSRAAERRARERKDYLVAGYESHAAYAAARRERKERADRFSTVAATAFNPSQTAAQFNRHPPPWGNQNLSGHREFLQALAEYLHEQEPDEYPEWYGNEGWWDLY